MRSILPYFPSGAVGGGLLLLRLSAALSLLAASDLDAGGATPWIAGLLAIALILGLRTRLAAALCLGLALIAFPDSGGLVVAIALILATAAVMLVGPGAYSIDAIVFGRRTIRLPGRPDEPRR
jgi:hypothetical protein